MRQRLLPPTRAELCRAPPQDGGTTMTALTGALRREEAGQKECRRLGKELDALQVPPAPCGRCSPHAYASCH